MRIVGGIFRGRVLKAPDGLDVRPTQDRVREALFSILMHDIAGARFLDLFAGAGTVGFEALSRGAGSATFVERSPRHAAFIEANAKALGVAPAIVRGDAFRYVAEHSAAPFDIAFADPPYALGEAHGFAEMLASAAARDVVRPGGLFVAETTMRCALADAPEWDLCRDREYGKSRLVVWKRRPGRAQGEAR